MIARTVSYAVILVSLAFAACGEEDAGKIEFPEDALLQMRSENGSLWLELRSSPQPPEQGTNHFEAFIVRSESYAPVTGLEIEVEPWMPAHGHGSPSEPSVEELGQGRYLIRDVAFNMAGEWELTIRTRGPVEDRFVVELLID
jgi:hypothetical protein